MSKSSWTAKLLGTSVVAAICLSLYIVLAEDWETVSLRCQPSPEQVICQISGEPYPGIRRNLEVTKIQLSGVESTYRSIEGNLVQHIVLATTDGRKIPLNIHPAGHLTIQLSAQKTQIATFIANPQAKTLNVVTQRNISWQLWIFYGSILGISGLYLKRLWSNSKPGLKLF